MGQNQFDMALTTRRTLIPESSKFMIFSFLVPSFEIPMMGDLLTKGDAPSCLASYVGGQ